MKHIGNYILGFILSLIFTALAFGMVWQYTQAPETFPAPHLIFPALIALAVVQLYCQIFFFLHVGRGMYAAWNIIALSFALFIVAVVAGGSIWIMDHLHHEVHTAEEIFESEAISPHATH